MTDKIKLKLLLLVDRNGKINELINDGFTYGQIASFIVSLVGDEYLQDSDAEGLRITEKAKEWMRGFKKSEKFKGSGNWIVPQEKSRIQKLDKNDIYLPNRNELHF